MIAPPETPNTLITTPSPLPPVVVNKSPILNPVPPDKANELDVKDALTNNA